MPKLNEVTFYGFTRDELDAIRRHTALSGEDEFTLDFLQKAAGIIGYSISTLILTGHPITLVKEVNSYEAEKQDRKRTGYVELPRQKAKVKSSMFQFMKTKKKGRKK